MILVFVAFLGLLFIGMPVGFAVGMSGALYFLQHLEFPMTTMVQLPITQTQSVTLLAVPLFIFAGNLMNASGITSQLIELATLLTGHLKGGLAQVSVVLSTLMGGVSGSTNADAAMESRILGPDMLKQGYSKGYTGAVIGWTALITSTIPPGVAMITYGTVANVSIGRLFCAGLTVGIVMMILYMLIVRITAGIKGYQPARTERAKLSDILENLKSSIWALAFPFLLLFGLRLGIFTTSECGAFACAYAVFVGVFIYKKLDGETFFDTMRRAILDNGGIMLMISMSGIFGYGVPLDKIPQKVTALITAINASPFFVMALVILFLIILGMFMEGSIIILLTTPILLPLVQSVGVNPIVFGLIVSVIVTMGNLTPPVGIAMYTVCDILHIDLKDYIIESLPFLIATLLEVALMLMFPQVVMAIPNLLFG
ncbi:MAG: TRAP transporter large permease [Candidatus Ventricola sp.]